MIKTPYIYRFNTGHRKVRVVRPQPKEQRRRRGPQCVAASVIRIQVSVLARSDGEVVTAI